MAEKTPPKEFVPLTGGKSKFRTALENYSKSVGGYLGDAVTDSGASTFGKDYLDNPELSRDLSTADMDYLQSTGGNVTGLIEQYRGENPAAVATRQASAKAAEEKWKSDEYWAKQAETSEWLRGGSKPSWMGGKTTTEAGGLSTLTNALKGTAKDLWDNDFIEKTQLVPLFSEPGSGAATWLATRTNKAQQNLYSDINKRAGRGSNPFA